MSHRLSHRPWPSLMLAFALAAAGALPSHAGSQGFIYGTITTDRGTTYKGRMRWNGDEEAFWGDIFNSTKEDRPYLDEIPRNHRRRRNPIKIFGVTIGVSWDDESSRQFVTRFGDIRSIEVRHGDEATMTMKSGTRYRVDGGSNDIGRTILVWDDQIGEIKVDWDRIDTITFMPAPPDLAVAAHRLQGEVYTEAGVFRGFVQWDHEECLSTDELDGDTDDGEVSIPMGNIRTIARRSRGSSRVTLRDGRTMVLDNSNDVDSSIRGIFVEDPRFGRVSVSWDAFDHVEFSDARDSGPAYADFPAGRPLRGAVTDERGRTHRGRIIYDMDESETWEFLNGSYRDVEYYVLFERIASIEPRGDDASRITLRTGQTIELEDAADVDDGNAGVMVVPAEGEPIYIAWEDLKRISFD